MIGDNLKSFFQKNPISRIDLARSYNIVYKLIFIGIIVGVIVSFLQKESVPQNTDFFSVYSFFIMNTIACLISIFSFFLFGLLPSYQIFNDSSMLGSGLSYSIKDFGIFHGSLLYCALTIPHGIFEWPAIVISSALGIWLGYLFFRKIFFKEHAEFKVGIKKASLSFLKIVLPLLVVAAIIEAYISPRITLRTGIKTNTMTTQQQLDFKQYFNIK